MNRVFTASVMVDGLKVYRNFPDDLQASMWIRMMTAQYIGRVASPMITTTTYSQIFGTPVDTRRCEIR